ncbi:MAG: RNA methyltransferase [Pseudomonadota bacterium]
MSVSVPPGSVHRITSLTNPQVKAIRALGQRKGRRATGTFLAEGLKLVRDGLEAGWTIESFAYSRTVADQDAVTDAALAARKAGAQILEVTDPIMEKIARRDNPQMVVGVFRQKVQPLDRLLSVTDGLWLCLEGIRDPGNLGTILRTAEAAGIDGVVLVGETTDPFGLEAVRASMGSLFHVRIARIDRAAFLEARPRWPGRIIGTHLSGTSDYRAVSKARPLTVFMGNEQSGLDDELAGCCDDLVIIPMRGKADSLNLAVATGIVLFDAALAGS